MPPSLYSVPPIGVPVVACWKYNLDFGADACVLGGSATDDAHSSPVGIPPDAATLAIDACAALGLAYGAVDVVLQRALKAETVSNGMDGGSLSRWAVLEVNACPAWNHFLSTHASVARRSIQAVVAEALQLQLT